jgi:multicomponent K+:H+ antiporter subunit C
VVLGLAMIGYAVNLFLFAMGRIQMNAPAILTETVKTTDPLPQALVLTAIVIGFATTAFIVQLAFAVVMNQVQIMWIPRDPALNYDPREDEP